MQHMQLETDSSSFFAPRSALYMACVHAYTVTALRSRAFYSPAGVYWCGGRGTLARSEPDIAFGIKKEQTKHIPPFGCGCGESERTKSI